MIVIYINIPDGVDLQCPVGEIYAPKFHKEYSYYLYYTWYLCCSRCNIHLQTSVMTNTLKAINKVKDYLANDPHYSTKTRNHEFSMEKMCFKWNC